MNTRHAPAKSSAPRRDEPDTRAPRAESTQLSPLPMVTTNAEAGPDLDALCWTMAAIFSRLLADDSHGGPFETPVKPETPRE